MRFRPRGAIFIRRPAIRRVPKPWRAITGNLAQILACANWEGRSPDRPTRREAPRHREAFGCAKTQGARLRRVGRSGDRPSQLAHAPILHAPILHVSILHVSILHTPILALYFLNISRFMREVRQRQSPAAAPIPNAGFRFKALESLRCFFISRRGRRLGLSRWSRL